MRSPLPDWTRVLAVVAHPDDESYALGGVIAALSDAGTHVAVLSMTAGSEMSERAASDDRLGSRALELRAAADHLGVTTTILLSHPFGALCDCHSDLVADIRAAIDGFRPDGLLVFCRGGGVTGDPDHEAASRAAVEVAEELALPVLGWGLPDVVARQLNDEYFTSFVGHTDEASTFAVDVDRARQYRAISEHSGQDVARSVLWHRLELLGAREHLRLLSWPARASSQSPIESRESSSVQ